MKHVLYIFLIAFSQICHAMQPVTVIDNKVFIRLITLLKDKKLITRDEQMLLATTEFKKVSNRFIIKDALDFLNNPDSVGGVSVAGALKNYVKTTTIPKKSRKKSEFSTSCPESSIADYFGSTEKSDESTNHGLLKHDSANW